ncbi:MAG: polyribonucleotide nucleotidyltransferase [Euzebyaceae bacterium]|jgi:polyribonucleotide nucleotidyltransferase|nr:polyribonucleotide nucleotidyltransferase [Euzebyaceae bacterium]
MSDASRATLGTTEASAKIGDAEIRFESGKLAGQAGGAVVAHLGETILLVTSTASRSPKEHLDFFPLTVDYEEKMYAAGKIPGGFFKREGRPSENAILTARLVDRPMRPTFDDGLRNEIQILITTLSADQVHTPDVLAINGASMATMLAGIPFDGPVAGVRMAMDRDGAWRVFPTFPYLSEEAVFDLVVAGRLNPESGEVDILMVEAEATENAVAMIEMGATKPTEEVLGQALQDAKGYLKQLCDLQLEFLRARGEQPTRTYPLFPTYDSTVFAAIERAVGTDLGAVLSDAAIDKSTRSDKVTALREAAVDAAFADAGDVEISDEELEKQSRNAFKALEKRLIRRRVVNEGVRIDGRGPKDLRKLSAEVGLLPRAHGSGLFTRGETQALNILTLGMLRDAQRLDTIDPNTEKRYIHHYNFPPYSTGETGFMRGPKRREIGHGALAERALLPVIPTKEDFAYALRLVSEVVSSNGSTSMASVCASTLSLMDAGVPIAAPVAGIAMGLISEDGRYTTLTDILGAEDAFGDMDFKVAGTSEFVTALQLDTKLSGIPADVLGEALGQAREARTEILQVIIDCIPEPRAEMNPHAPRVLVEYIPGDKIGEVIGPKGKIIREITEETGADINIDDVDGRGVVHIYSADSAKAQMALDRIRAIANPVVPKEGERYFGTVVKTADFGAFISLTPGSDGLLHISKLPKPEGQRLGHADEAVTVGQKMWVEVVEVKDGRKFSLAMVEGPQGESGGRAAAAAPSGRTDAPAPARDRDPRPQDRGDRGAPPVRERVRERSVSSSPDASASDDAGGDEQTRRRRRRRG